MRTIEATPSLVPGSTVHRFELAGLGKAPFRFVGTEEIVHVNPDGTTRAGGSCDHCTTCIRLAYWIRSADGRRFKVGCDCVYKTGDTGLMRVVSKAEAKRRREQNAKRKATRQAKAAAVAGEKFAETLGLLDAIAARAPEGSFAHGFAVDVAARLRSGQATRVSPRQMDLIVKLGGELANR